MANKYTDGAFGARGLKPIEKLVLWVVSQRTNNDDGTCYPSYARIADDAGIHRTTAINLVKRLMARGLISVVGQHGDANLYRVSLSKMQELAVASSAPPPGELPTATRVVAHGYSGIAHRCRG